MSLSLAGSPNLLVSSSSNRNWSPGIPGSPALPNIQNSITCQFPRFAPRSMTFLPWLLIRSIPLTVSFGSGLAALVQSMARDRREVIIKI